VRVAASIVVALLAGTVAGAASGVGSSSGGGFGIYEVRIDGSEHKELLRNPRVQSVAEMSPDRGHILFIEHALPPVQESQLYAAAVDGSDVRLLATGSFIGAPAWSSDGQKIAFEGQDSTRCRHVWTRCARGEIWLVNPDGTGLERFVVGGIAPSWSPDSQQIAFAGHYNPYYGRGVVSVATIGVPDRIRELSSLEYQSWPEWKLRWSPVADRVTYAVSKGRRSHVRVARLNAPPQRGARTLLGGDGPSWSPDGRRLAFWRRSPRLIYVVDANGRRPRRLTRGMDPVWSPDGRWIAFVDDSPYRCFQIYVMRPNGRDQRVLTDEPCDAHFELFWAPDSERLVYTASVPEPREP
jgi:Tol biopolymer transport system component